MRRYERKKNNSSFRAVINCLPPQLEKKAVLQSRLKVLSYFIWSELLYLDNRKQQRANPITNCLTGLLTGSSRVISLSQPRKPSGQVGKSCNDLFLRINV